MNRFGLAIWLHSVTGFESEQDVRRHADRLAENGVDILIPCVKNPPGAVDFLTDAGAVNPDYPEWDPLQVPLLHRHPVDVAGSVSVPRHDVIASGQLLQALPVCPDRSPRIAGATRGQFSMLSPEPLLFAQAKPSSKPSASASGRSRAPDTLGLSFLPSSNSTGARNTE